jgi:hypothetical protein
LCYLRIDRGEAPAMAASPASSLAAACAGPIKNAEYGWRIINLTFDDRVKHEMRLPEFEPSVDDSDDVRDATTFDLEKDWQPVLDRVQDSGRTISSYTSGPDAKDVTNDLSDGELLDQRWEFQDLYPALTLWAAMKPVRDVFASTESILKVFTSKTPLSSDVRAAFLELLRHIYENSKPSFVPEGEPAELERAEDLADATLSGLLSGNYPKLDALLNKVQRRIEVTLDRLRSRSVN